MLSIRSTPVERGAAPLSPDLAREIDALERWIPDVSEGDRLTLEWTPGRSTRITSTATPAPLIASSAFGRAVLSMWVGPRPVDERLKADMLGDTRGKR